MTNLGGRVAGRALAAVLLWLPVAEAGGKLDRVRDATSSRDRDRDDDDDDDHDHGYADHDDDDDDGGVVGAILRGLFSGDGEEATASERPASDSWFLPYPYAEGHGGNMFFRRPPPTRRLVPVECPPSDPYCLGNADLVARAATCVDGFCYVAADEGAEQAEARPRTQGHRLRLAAEFGGDVDGLYRHAYGLWFESTGMLGVEVELAQWIEPLTGGGTDQLMLADGSVFLRLVESPRVQAHLGAGLRALFDGASERPAGGFNGMLSIEGYPVSPLTVRGALDLGNLGPAFFLEAQATAGAMLGRFELFAGYRGMLIDPVGFHGPFAGIRLHL